MTLRTRHFGHLGRRGPRLPPPLNLGARAGIRSSQLRDLTPSREAALRRILSPALYAPLLLCQQLDTGPKLSPSWLHNKRPPRRGFHSREWRRSRTRGLEGLTPEEPGRSDLIKSEYARGRHLPSRRFTSLPSEVRLGGIPEGNTITTT